MSWSGSSKVLCGQKMALWAAFQTENKKRLTLEIKSNFADPLETRFCFRRPRFGKLSTRTVETADKGL